MLDYAVAYDFEQWSSAMTLDTGERWVAEEFQLAVAADLLAGVQVVWMVVPEGNTKTTFAAGVALHHIERKRRGYVAVAASSRDQAEWLWRQAQGLVIDSDRNHEFVCLEGYRRIRYDRNDSRIQIFAADDRGGDGAIASLYILDELHRHKDLALYRTWLGKLKKRNAQMLVISTAGEVGGEFEEERDRFRRGGNVTRRGCWTRAERPNAVLHDWQLSEDADPEDMVAVKAANPFSGVTVETLSEKRALPGMTLAHWMRYSCNRPQRGEMAAITESEWWRARVDEMIPEGERVRAGLDLGWKRDTTALVPLWSPSRDVRRFGPAVVLEPPDDGDQLDAHKVERALEAVHERNPIWQVVMDMTNGAQLSQWIEANLGAEVVDRTQSDSFAALDYAYFMEGLREGWIQHQGDVDLTAHALNAIAQELPSGKVRFQRPKEGRQVRTQLRRRRVIDALTAAAMVHTACAAEWGDPPAGETQPMYAFV